jgi:hypothetical protein
MNLLLVGLTLQEAVAQELKLLNWLIAEAASAHESHKAHAAANRLPEPLHTLRLLEKLQRARTQLLNIPLGPLKDAPDKAAKQPRLVAEAPPQAPDTPTALPPASEAETAAPQAPAEASPANLPAHTPPTPQCGATGPQPTPRSTVGAEGSPPPAQHLNRAQRRALARRQLKQAHHQTRKP